MCPPHKALLIVYDILRVSSRLALLFVALLTVTAGCNSAPASPPTDETTVATSVTPTTSSLTPTPTTTAPACTKTYQPSNPALPANETRELPEKPETLNETAVESLVRETEQVVPFNERYESHYQHVTIVVRSVRVEETDDGFTATISHVDWYTRSDHGNHTHVGSTAWSAYYVVNESSIARSEASAAVSDPPEPTVIHCWNSTA